jgi:hypothetical protein
MVRKQTIFLTVTYPFKEYDYDVDEFIIDAFELFGISCTGSGTNFNSRNVNGHCSDEHAVEEFVKYIQEVPFPFQVDVYSDE